MLISSFIKRSFLRIGESRNSCLAQVLRIMTVSVACYWVVYNDGLHPGLRERHRRVGGKGVRVRRWGRKLWNTVHGKDSQCAHLLATTVDADQNRNKIKPAKLLARMQEGLLRPTLSREALSSWWMLREKSHFSLDINTGGLHKATLIELSSELLLIIIIVKIVIKGHEIMRKTN